MAAIPRQRALWRPALPGVSGAVPASRWPPWQSCEGAHGDAPAFGLQCRRAFAGSKAISEERAFTDCVVLEKDAFDPDAVFLDDIVDDAVLPRLTLAVDGLTTPVERIRGGLELAEEDAANEAIRPSTALPPTSFDPEQLEVYGWETTLWRKIRGYLGL